MATQLIDLVIDRVDLVDEGANSASYIEIFKRKEQSEIMKVDEVISKMKEEHAQVIQKELDDKAKLETDNATLVTKNAELTSTVEELVAKNATLETELEVAKAACGTKDPASADTKVPPEDDEEEVMKSLPEEARAIINKAKADRDAAQAELSIVKAADAEKIVIAKANELKALPIETDKLIGILKSATPDLLDALTAINVAIEKTALTEIGNTNSGKADDTTDAWGKIEKAAKEVATRDTITIAKATAVVIKEQPELYKEYLNQGGTN
jgi:hypothetical protein